MQQLHKSDHSKDADNTRLWLYFCFVFGNPRTKNPTIVMPITVRSIVNLNNRPYANYNEQRAMHALHGNHLDGNHSVINRKLGATEYIQ